MKRPTRVVVVDADNPLEEVHGEFFWREDHERALQVARQAAYRAGYQDALAAASRLARGQVRVVPRPRLVFRALMLLITIGFFASLIGGFVR